MKTLIALGLAAGLVAAPFAAEASMPATLPATPAAAANPAIILAADGCGGGWYRGPGGACHRFGYGPYPNGYYSPGPAYYAPAPAQWAPPRGAYCGYHQIWVYGPYGGGHWARRPNC